MTRPKLFDWWTNEDNVQIYPDEQGAGTGWVAQACHCPECGHEWAAVAANDSRGIECPECGHTSLDYQWGSEVESE